LYFHKIWNTFFLYSVFSVLCQNHILRNIIWNIRNPCFRSKSPVFRSKPLFLGQNPCFWVKNPVFRIYRIYYIKIEFLVTQKNRSNSNFNRKFDYEFGMQGFTTEASLFICVVACVPWISCKQGMTRDGIIVWALACPIMPLRRAKSGDYRGKMSLTNSVRKWEQRE